MKKVVISFILLIIGVGVFFMSRSGLGDRINPFLKAQNYYTIVETDGKYLGKDKIHKNEECYRYEFTGYSSEGKEQKIIVNAPKKLRHGAYLSILSAGKSGKNYSEVKADEIPAAAKTKLRLK